MPRRTRSKRSRNAPIAFEDATFGYLRTGESDVLLRLSGRWAAGRQQAVPGIELRLLHGADSTTLEPLPDPANFPVAATPKGVEWRAAFPALLEQLDEGDARFVLSLSDGAAFDLPAPTDLDAPEPEPAPEPAPEPEPQPRKPEPTPLAALPEAERIKAIIAESIERFGVLEERIDRERTSREHAEQRLAALEAERADALGAVEGSTEVHRHLDDALEQAEAARAQAEAARDEALANVASLESQLEATSRELEQAWGDAEQHGGAAESELLELRSELDAARADAEKLKTVLEVANAARQAAEEQLASRESAEAPLREKLEAVERDLAAAQDQAEDARVRLANAMEQVADHADLEERLADTERVAERVGELERAMALTGDQAAAQVAQARAEAERELRDALAAAQAHAEEFERRFLEADRASEEFARRAREAEEAAAESASALEDAVGERGRVESRIGQLEAQLAEAEQLASAEAMAREDLQRRLDAVPASSDPGEADKALRRELEKALETAVRERGQRASFEQELKRRDNEEFELRNAVERLEGELEKVRGKLAERDEMVTEWKRRVEDTRAALESAEAAASEARVARAQLERDLRELSEDDDDAETTLARHKTELADLRRDAEETAERDRDSARRIAELERTLDEFGGEARSAEVQQAFGEIDRLRAALGQATTMAQEEATRREQLEEELQSRVVAEERLRAMLQAKVATKGAPASGDDAGESPDVDLPRLPATDSATTQGDFLERLAAAKRQAEAVER